MVILRILVPILSGCPEVSYVHHIEKETTRISEGQSFVSPGSYGRKVEELVAKVRNQKYMYLNMIKTEDFIYSPLQLPTLAARTIM